MTDPTASAQNANTNGQPSVPPRSTTTEETRLTLSTSSPSDSCCPGSGSALSRGISRLNSLLPGRGQTQRTSAQNSATLPGVDGVPVAPLPNGADEREGLLQNGDNDPPVHRRRAATTGSMTQNGGTPPPDEVVNVAEDFSALVHVASVLERVPQVIGARRPTPSDPPTPAPAAAPAPTPTRSPTRPSPPSVRRTDSMSQMPSPTPDPEASWLYHTIREGFPLLMFLFVFLEQCTTAMVSLFWLGSCLKSGNWWVSKLVAKENRVSSLLAVWVLTLYMLAMAVGHCLVFWKYRLWVSLLCLNPYSFQSLSHFQPLPESIQKWLDQWIQTDDVLSGAQGQSFWCTLWMACSVVGLAKLLVVIAKAWTFWLTQWFRAGIRAKCMALADAVGLVYCHVVPLFLWRAYFFNDTHKPVMRWLMVAGYAIAKFEVLWLLNSILLLAFTLFSSLPIFGSRISISTLIIASRSQAQADGELICPICQFPLIPENEDEEEGENDEERGVSGGGAGSQPIPSTKAVEKASSEIIRLNCGHAFCEECILRWVSRQPDCPLCRQYVPQRIGPDRLPDLSTDGVTHPDRACM